MRGRKDLDDDGNAREAEAKAVDVKVKSAEAGEAALGPNIVLMRKIQDEKWETYEWFDAEVNNCPYVPFPSVTWILVDVNLLISYPVPIQSEDAWTTYENFMIHQNPEDLQQLQSALDGEAYLDVMSAPRVDPARPELTGWAMKQNRKRQKGVTDTDGQ